MLSAYLREPSLIPADYPNGVRSILRQELILNHIELDNFLRNQEIELNTCVHLMVNTEQAQPRSEMAHTYGQMLSMGKLLRDRNIKGAKMLSPESRTQKMINVYEVLRANKLLENPERTFTDEEFREIMERMKEEDSQEEHKDA